jgi:MtN3 and saliva related transmembrane protein
MNLVPKIVAWIFGAGLVINAGLFIPQAIKIWKEKTAKGVSLTTFGGFNILQISGILHGYFNSDPFLMWGMCISFITCGFVTVGILIYGNQKR